VPISDQLGALFGSCKRSPPPDRSEPRQAVVPALVASCRRSTIRPAPRRCDVRNGQAVVTLASQANSFAAKSCGQQAATSSSDPTAADRRDQLAQQLSQLVEEPPGSTATATLRFVLDGGATLVDGNFASKITAAPDPVTKALVVSVNDGATSRDVTSQIGKRPASAATSAVPLAVDQPRRAVRSIRLRPRIGINAVSTGHAGLDGVGRPQHVHAAETPSRAAPRRSLLIPASPETATSSRPPPSVPARVTMPARARCSGCRAPS